ncbi:hypothetical protein Lqui_1383 [Legionella quinlivanii]|uniref:Uncharacterized protein n=1 Tax=Legionella quinlivanii TaxID=45073 RepID=A0A0W0XZS4_9GAMM|nr:hypothetical protein [Legionella quinlivanii]KTD50058.1 hypothetical protein Lqui_1383 [Legionella quinlivanii]MCW8450666.1 hypothetical protein [Legionella quinlivanii]SEF93179.1 hypothetical protein SAMN02746093_01413 [Legionella quinlivanii DSM 21216]STY11166.1 Uncharacterised protein [Legionella quinlivanii]
MIIIKQIGKRRARRSGISNFDAIRRMLDEAVANLSTNNSPRSSVDNSVTISVTGSEVNIIRGNNTIPAPDFVTRYWLKLPERANANGQDQLEQLRVDLNKEQISHESIKELKESGESPRSKLERCMLFLFWKVDRPVVKQTKMAEPTAPEKTAPAPK